MIDLTNKNINELINKHLHLIQDLKKENIPEMAYIIEIAIEHIQSNHHSLFTDWKAWLIIVLKKLQEKNKLNSKKDIINHIDNFVKFKKENYDNYVIDIAMFTNEYHRDYPFIVKYLKTIGI